VPINAFNIHEVAVDPDKSMKMTAMGNQITDALMNWSLISVECVLFRF
jgi:hypothetical protein